MMESNPEQEEEVPATEMRMSAGECFAIGIGILIVQDEARKLHLEYWRPELHFRIQSLARYILAFSKDPVAKSHRVRLDALSLAIVMFGLRALRKDLKRGMYQHFSWPEGVPLLPPLDRLEKFRKRAKRQWIAQWGRTAYDEWHLVWRAFTAAIPRTSAAKIRLVADYKKQRLARLVNFTNRTLSDANFTDLPDEKTLTAWVKRMRALARKARGEATTRDLAQENEYARRWILKYMEKQVINLRKALISQARVNPDSPLAQSARSAEMEFEDVESLCSIDWIGVSARGMSLAELRKGAGVDNEKLNQGD